MSTFKMASTWILIVLLAGALMFVWRTRQKADESVWTAPAQSNEPLVTLPRPTILITDPAQGPSNAPVTIIEFADFRCPHCVEADQTLHTLMQNYPNKIRLVWKDFPIIPARDESVRAHTAARCAEAQGKFWEYHDALFANQNILSSSEYPILAGQIGLDAQAFQTCLTNTATAQLMEQSFAEGKNLGVDGTPTLYVNGNLWSGAIADISRVIDAAK